MAQMEHRCLDCDHIEFNNNMSCEICVMCGGSRITSCADEDFNYGKDQEMDFENDNGQEDQA